MLQISTVKKSIFVLLKCLQAESLLATTRLVDGTALSQQIGHRKSDDLDLFSVEPLEGMRIASAEEGIYFSENSVFFLSLCQI